MIPICPSGTEQPFFCVPGINGNPLALYQLATKLGPNRPFWCFEPVPVDDRSARFASVEAIAARYTEQIRLQQPYGPYNLGGFSAGGAFAFEMARQLTDAGESVPVLALFDTYNPAFAGTLSKSHLALVYLRFFIRRTRVALRQIVKLSGSDRNEYLRTLRRNITSHFHRMDAKVRTEPSSKVLARIQQVADLYTHAYQIYKPGVYTGRIALFKAGIPEVEPFQDPHNGWRHLAAGGIDLHIIAGNHQTMMHSSELPVAVRSLLASADPSPARQPSHPQAELS